MRRASALLAVVAVAILGFAATRPARVAAEAPSSRSSASPLVSPVAAPGGLPASFDANEGQFQDAVGFVAHAGGITAGFFDGAAVLNLRGGDALCMRFGGEAPAPERPSAARASYFLGDDPARWRPDVASYERLVCSDVAPGVDLVWRGTQRALEYDLVVAPGADPSAATIGFDAASAAVDPATGDLVLVTAGGNEVRHSRPRCFQTVGGARRDVAAEFVVEGTSVRFCVGAYDRMRELVIDPVISLCSYLGGPGTENYASAAVGSTGDVYVCGTAASGFPLVNPYQSQVRGNTDAFVTRIRADGSGMVFSTYVGGSTAYELATTICVDALGDSYVGGETTATDFPVVAAVQGTAGAKANGFAFKLAASGTSLVYSTYLGGSGDDTVLAVAVDSAGALAAAGSTASTDLPVVNARQSAFGGGVRDGFVAKLVPAGSAFTYSTYHGGTGADSAFECAVDASGSVYVVGESTSTDLPLANAQQVTLRGTKDAFLAKYNSTGSAFVYATYLGGSGTDSASSVSVDPGGRAWVCGTTDSSDFPTTASAYRTAIAGLRDAFVTALTSNGNAVVYSTVLGVGVPLSGGGYAGASSIAVDGSNGFVMTGQTVSQSVATFNAIQPTYNGNGKTNGFVARFVGTPPTPVYVTYFGGNGEHDYCETACVDPQGAAVIVGHTSSSNLPVTSAFQGSLLGFMDVYVLRLAPVTPSPPLDLAAALEGEISARLTWLDASSDESGFEIQRRMNSGPYTTYALVPAGTETYLDTSVFASVTYTYRVCALGAEGPSAFSNEAAVASTGGSGVPPAPLAPDQLEALVVTPSEVALTWRDRSNDELGFDVQRADGAGEFESIGSAPQDFPAYSDTEVPPGWPVAYRVRALAPQGPSAFANPALVTTPATFEMTTRRGLLVDTATAGRDRVEWRVSITADEDAVLDPRATGLRLQVGPRDAPLVLAIPAGDPRWRVHRTRFAWKSPPGTLARFEVVVDTKRRTVAVNAARFDHVLPPDGPTRLLLAMGSEGGAVAETWVPARKSGRLVPDRD